MTKVQDYDAVIQQVFTQVLNTTKLARGIPKSYTLDPKPANGHHRVNGKTLSAMWFWGVHNVGFRVTWWDSYPGLMEFFAWNHNAHTPIMNVAITTRQPDFAACERLIRMVGLMDAALPGLEDVGTGQ